MQERFDAQRAAARAKLAPVARDDWWDKATPEMIERAHETATAWKAYDPEAAQAAERIRDQVQARYGIDVNNPGADEASVSEALARAQRARLEAETGRTIASAARTDEAVAGRCGCRCQRAEQGPKAQGKPAYDSPERRQQLAERLEGKGDRDAVTSRLLADKHQGMPAILRRKALVGQDIEDGQTGRPGKKHWNAEDSNADGYALCSARRGP